VRKDTKARCFARHQTIVEEMQNKAGADGAKLPMVQRRNHAASKRRTPAMNDHILNALSRRLATRRITLRVFAASLSAVVFATTSRDASVHCGHIGSRCHAKHDCCDGARCKHNHCKCRSGRTKCDNSGGCVNLDSDSENCGACGNPCVDNRICSNGVCCKTGETGCNGNCCSRLEPCLPKGVPGEDVCCATENVFVRCDNAFIELRDGHLVCLAPIDPSEHYGQICCPPESICGDFCCEPVVEGDTSVCDPDLLICETGANSPASYVRPGRRPQ
jgi:hypothetical protein